MRILKPSRVILMILFCRVRVLGFFSGRSLSRGYKPRNLGIKMDSDLPKPHPDILGKQVIVLAGATSVGKSACAVQLCKHIDAEIIIADSVQVYRHLDIGSNKPSAAEMAAIPHHLVNIREPHETVSSGDFVRLAVPIIFDILSRGKTPIIVGGSTMWLQWLVSGMPDAPKADEEAVKEAEGMLKSFVDSGNWDGAVSVVAKYDRQRSEKLGRNDWYRLHRYLEVALCVLRNNGRKNNDSSIAGNGDGDGDSSDGILPLKRSHDDEGEGDNVVEADGMSVIVTGRREKVLAGIDVRCFFLSEDREELYRYIDTRCESMLKAGLFQEVSDLVLSNKLTPDCIAARAIGYRQTLEYLCDEEWQAYDEKAFEKYVKQFATATRNYAKRQLQWYRKDNSFLWLKIDRKNVEKDDMVPYNRVCEEIKHWCGMSTPDFNVAIQQQVQRGLAVTAARNRKKSGHKPKLTQPLDALVYENVSTSVDIVTPFSLKNYADKYTSLSTDLLSNEVVVNGSEIASKSIWNSSQSHSVSQIDEVAVEVEYKLSKQEQEALLHLGNSKRGDEDLSAYLPIMEWSAEELSIRAAEGIKRSTVLKTYQTRFRVDSSSGSGSGSGSDELIRLGDVFAQELRRGHPAIVKEFHSSFCSKNSR